MENGRQVAHNMADADKPHPVTKESFKPIPVQSPSTGKFAFALRCMVDLQLKTIVQHLKPELFRTTGKVLDVGAGASPWRDWLVNASSYQALDIDSAAEFGMGRDSAGIIYYDGINMPIQDGQYDAVMCIEVLEHAQDPGKLVSEIFRVLKHGGKLILTMPWSARRHHIPHDYQRLSREGLHRLLTSEGFSDIHILDRGDEVAVIANKLTILTLNLLSQGSSVARLLKLPASVGCGVMASLFLVVANFRQRDHHGRHSEDPLGYFLTARKSLPAQPPEARLRPVNTSLDISR